MSEPSLRSTAIAEARRECGPSAPAWVVAVGVDAALRVVSDHAEALRKAEAHSAMPCCGVNPQTAYNRALGDVLAMLDTPEASA